MTTKQLYLILSLFAITLLTSCDSHNTAPPEELPELTSSDIAGQWTLLRIDTIHSKQSLALNKEWNNSWVEYERSLIEPVDGVLKCVSFCPSTFPEKELEFANDSVFEYVFPTHIRSENKLQVLNNQLTLKGINSIWSMTDSEIGISMSANQDTLKVSYLENTGLYLTEVYGRAIFDQELVSFLRTYSHNLPYASGKYKLVRYFYESVDYDSPFEHYHSFPHTIPETLHLSEDDLIQVLKNEDEIQLLTDGELKPYNLSWSWGDRFWITPKEWYTGPDSSYFIIYDKE